MFSLKLLGGVSIRVESGSPGSEAGQARRVALLALLATTRNRAMTRDKLIGYLWPDTGEEQARHLLSESLYVLRKSLGAGTLLSEGEIVRVNLDLITCDVIEFEAALERGDVEYAVSVYGGPLLDGFYVRDAPEFERWVESERRRLSDAFATALEKLAEATEVAEDHVTAVAHWKRLSAHDPYNSRYVLRSMQAMAAVGDPANAVQVAEEHARVLEQDLGMEPPGELVRFANQLRLEPIPPERTALARVRAKAPADRFNHAAEFAEAIGGSATQVTAAGRGASATVRTARRWIAGAGAVALAALVLTVPFWRGSDETLPSLPAMPDDQRPSVALLPFDNLSPDPDDAYFAAGVHEEILTHLARIAALKVISRTSVLEYKDRDRNLREIADELGVNNILEGTVRRDRDRLRITVQLIDARTDEHLWGESYDGDLSDIFAVQSDVARSVAERLEASLAPDELARIDARPTQSPEAYAFYLRALEFKEDGIAPKTDFARPRLPWIARSSWILTCRRRTGPPAPTTRRARETS
jgi:TolB-like protein/DNA-binding SARP family transcriptional activator